MSWLQRIFGFQGRIGRRDYWIIVLGAFLLNGVIMMIFPVPFAPQALLTDEDPIRRAWLAATALEAHWIDTLAGVLLLWPLLAAGVKRLHDRGKSGLWLIAFWAPAVATGVVSVVIRQLWLALFSGYGGSLMMWPYVPFLTAGSVAFLLWLWGLIEMGFMPGDEGRNDYGRPTPAADDRTATA